MSFCQNQDEKYVITKFNKGLPPEIPFKWDKAFYTSINSGDFFQSLYLVSRDSLKTPNESFLFIIDSIGFSYKTVDFIKLGQNIYKSTVSLITKDEDKLDSLRLVLNLKERTLSYSWNNKTKIPTVIEKYKLKVGAIFPQINVKTANGNWTNKDQNKIIVINWWATSCLPCIEEIPVLNELTKKFSNNNVEFIAIVWDTENQPGFIKKHPFKYIQGFGSETLNEFFGEIFPRHIIINRDGRILLNKLGGSKQIGKELDSIITSRL
ncbi:MAG: TlpA disulfide reductase family protein [Ignavibacteriota bacterium]